MTSNNWTPERFDRISDFWADRLVLESAALDVYGLLAEKPLGPEQLATRLRLDPRAALLFLDALAGLGLLTKMGRRYTNSAAAERYLVPTSPDYLGHRLVAARNDWHLWSHLSEALRTGEKQRDTRIFLEDPEAARPLLLSLHRNARSRATDILDRGLIDLASRRRLLDLGGGAGTYSVVFCRAYPQLQATLVDRPIAAELARDFVSSAGLEDRIAVLDTDVDERELPSEYDFIWVSNVVHSRSFNANRALLERLYRRTQAGGEVAVHDIIMEEDRTQPASGAVFSVHMLLSNGVGRCYTYHDVHTWLTGAGFRDVRWVRDDSDYSIVIGRR